ncbi:hypothetical protein [Streptomyces sp. B6B3]|uniref:hypothetical protein n=1 Tax=Streptomyces sp. B6B3 TaxID=3153570 RepID=UPI00325E458C
MGGTPRDPLADRATITAAAERLLTGNPLRSSTGKLTTSELAIEAGLRRDILYQHRDLVESYQAQIKTRDAVPEAMAAMARELEEAREELKSVRQELAAERAATALLRRAVTELTIEAEAAGRPGGRAPRGVTPLVPGVRSRHRAG